MQMPIQITSRQFEITPPIRNSINEKAEKLDRFHDHIISCRVTIDKPHKHKHKGRLYNLLIDLTVPGKEIVVKNEPHDDLYVSIRDAFEVAKRRLIEYEAKRRSEYKQKDEFLLPV